MASKEIKNELKSARESIQNKDYHAALKHCKAVLKLDKTNYNAFVFVGVASIELGKPEQAQAAYKKAIDINPENILAWQGLASLHEKEPEFGKKEDVIEVYGRLMKHYESSDNKKWSEIVLKLVDVHKSLKNIEEALNLLKLLQDGDCEKDQYLLWCKSIALLQENQGSLTSIQKNELVNAYRHVLHGNIQASDETRQYFQDYINLLLDDATFSVQDILSEAKRMKDVFEKDEFPLNILAKLYLEQILELNDEECLIYEELLALNAESYLAYLGLGKVKLFEKDFTPAEEYLKNGLQHLPNSSLGWYFLSQTQLLHHQYEDVFNSCTKGLDSLKNDESLYNQDLVFSNLSLCKAKSSSRLGKEGIAAAIVQLKELSSLQPNNLDGHIELGKIFVRINNVEAAKKCLENALNVEKTSSRCSILEGEIFAAEGQFENAETSFLHGIELQQDVAESYLNLGKLYWKAEGKWRTQKDKCLNCLLKAAKLDPYNSSIFLYLGHFYQIVGLDSNKALRCYKKAHDLNPFCDETGEALGDVYMSSGLE
ncbi:tetratricopeptide repeat 37, partial [Paramuricea clavata]